jgi:hypothetical protein
LRVESGLGVCLMQRPLGFRAQALCESCTQRSHTVEHLGFRVWGLGFRVSVPPHHTPFLLAPGACVRVCVCMCGCVVWVMQR